MARKVRKPAQAVQPARGGPQDKSPTSQRCVGAKGYGLNEDQQKAIADLWAWQEQSMRSKVVLGGPVA
jgi:hypothetical protein